MIYDTIKMTHFYMLAQFSARLIVQRAYPWYLHRVFVCVYSKQINYA